MGRVLLASITLVLAAAERPGEFAGVVVGVSDGDTIRVMRDGRFERVRLWGIDCPENGQPFSTQAKQFTSEVAFGKTVTGARH